ncbi:TonB-dependent receptor [Brumicola nitratireducens]|uniref:TonB-dependent receptor n=1 Tax=Glaciecola nitratireducens (strain JCM 12485 / KCTC 12276 / FR1064) TaxID=1085623 RepID=G4QNA7_GLANF|nr:TonB-dependent receptor [Glaciecola nitratireducens]AEP31526.1 TonB-dependent receptor [Glaciecola nitratireducens FR1064]
MNSSFEISAIRKTMLAVSISAVLSGVVSAQEATVEKDDSSTADTKAVELIMVKGTRRTQELQDAPVALTAFTAEDIDGAGIERPADFIGLTPNVTLIETQNAGMAFITVRGISQNRDTQPSVAVIIDGVEQTDAGQFQQELFDIQQIEVLKGPQGGLYGRNAIGGAIVITTKDPSENVEGRVKVGIDNGPGYKVEAGLSGPAGEDWAYRISGSYYDTDGYIENTFLNEESDPLRDISLRGKALWFVNDQLEIDFRGYYSALETQPFNYRITPDVNTILDIRTNNPGINDRDLYGASVKVSYETADGGEWTSITAWDRSKELIAGDAFDFLPVEESLLVSVLGLPFDQSQISNFGSRSWSQELRFTSSDDERFKYIYGAYIVDTEQLQQNGARADFGLGFSDPLDGISTDPNNFQLNFLSDVRNNFAWAFFGNASYEVDDMWTVDASLRYDKDDRENLTQTPQAFIPNVPGFPVGTEGEVRKKSFSQLQPKFTLTYEPMDELTLYGGYSVGFRSGGFNQTGSDAIAGSAGIIGIKEFYDAETAKTFEVGGKFKLPVASIRGGFALYSTDSENSPFFVFLQENSTQNIGVIPEAKFQGFEFEMTANPLPGLRFNAALGYVDSEIKDFGDPTVIGNRTPAVSKTTVNLGTQYRMDVNDGIDSVVWRIDYQQIGKTNFDIYESTEREPVNLVNARVTYEAENWTLALWANNLTDEQYNSEWSPGGFIYRARPRVYGLTYTYNFDL